MVLKIIQGKYIVMLCYWMKNYYRDTNLDGNLVTFHKTKNKL